MKISRLLVLCAGTVFFAVFLGVSGEPAKAKTNFRVKPFQNPSAFKYELPQKWSKEPKLDSSALYS